MKAIDLAIVKALLNQSIPHVVDGKDGVDGQTGPKGDTGASGERGEVGKQGTSGKDGRDAVDGLQGAAGLDGLPGKDGLDGKPGKDGKVGKAGLDGVDGKQGPRGKVGPKGDTGDAGKGISSIKVNEENMLVITYDNGEMDIAGKVSVTRESTTVGGGLPLGSFGLTGTKTNDAGELIILGTWGKEFNTGFTSGGGVTLSNPTFTYTSGALTSVAYTGGHTKALAYNGDGTLNTVVTTINGQATTKTLSYSPDGTLASVTES
jgi:hypothetical protein